MSKTVEQSARERMNQAIAIDMEDRDEATVNEELNVSLWTDNEWHVAPKFKDDSRYTNALSLLHETEMTQIDLRTSELIDNPRELAESVRQGFEAVANNLGGLDLKAELEVEQGQIVAKFINRNGEYAGEGYLYDGNFTSSSSGYAFLDILKEGIAEMAKEKEAALELSNECRKELIKAGANGVIYGDSTEQYHINVGCHAGYEDLDASEIHQDIYNSTYLHQVGFSCVQDFAKLFAAKKGASYEDTVYFSGSGNIDSYGTIACDTEVGMRDNDLTMSIRGYDKGTKGYVFSAVANVQIECGIEGDMDDMSEDLVLTADDIWPTHVGVMSLDGRNPEDVIANLPILCDKRNVEIQGEELRIPMATETGKIMMDMGMIKSLEARDKTNEMSAPAKTAEVALNEGLVTEATKDKESQLGGN